jgi:hypothetical protein
MTPSQPVISQIKKKYPKRLTRGFFSREKFFLKTIILHFGLFHIVIESGSKPSFQMSSA